MAKALVLLSVPPVAVQHAAAALCEQLQQQFATQTHITLQLMQALAQDPFYQPQAPYPRPQLLLEMVSAPGQPLPSLYQQLTRALDLPAIERSECLALVMRERTFIPCAPQPVYYHYLMLKRSEFSTADYMDYYARYHSNFGIHTPGIAGYSQNDVDPEGSRLLATTLGLGYRNVTSISELKLASMSAFVANPGVMALAEPAALDEARFVDREQSIMFSSEVIFRAGDFNIIDQPVFSQHVFGQRSQPRG